MSKPTKLRGSMLDRLRRTFAAKDEAGFEEAMSAVEEAAEATEEEQAQAALANTIAEAVANAMAPIVERLDGVEALTNDLKTRDAGEAAAAVGQDVVAAGGEGGKEFQAFLKSKGLSDADIAEAMAMMKTPTEDDDPSGSIGTQSGSPDDPSGMSHATQEVPDDQSAAGVSGMQGTPSGESSGSAGDRVGLSGTDSAKLVTEFRDTVARAEILAPGIKLPTFDAKAAPKRTADAICALRRAALKSAFDSADRRKHVAPFVTDAAAIGKMGCDAAKLAFVGASELAKITNNAGVRTSDAATQHAAARDNVATFQAAADALWKSAR